MKQMLNDKNARVVVEGGVIVALEFHPDGDYHQPQEPTAADYELLKLDPDNLGCVDEHPEGADRGGWVPTLTNGCYFMEASNEWC